MKAGQVATVHGLRASDEGVMQAANVSISGHELDGVTSDLPMRAGLFEGLIDLIDKDGAVTLNGITVSPLASVQDDVINTMQPGMLVRLVCRWQENAWMIEEAQVL